jgi:hypothetical protein
MKYYPVIFCVLALLLGACPMEGNDKQVTTEEDKQVTLGSITFAPYPASKKIDLKQSSDILAMCEISNKDNDNVKYYYTLDGTEPTESSDYYQGSPSDSPIKFGENEYTKQIKVLAVYDNNGEKLTAAGEAQYNIKFFRTGKTGLLSDIEIAKGRGYYGYDYFSDMFGGSNYKYYYEAAESGVMKIIVSSSNTSLGTIAVYKNGAEISVYSNYYKDSISVTAGDRIRITATQGSRYEVNAKDPHFNYQIALE